MSEKKEKIQLIQVEELVEGNSIFQSNGISYLKVTRGEDVQKLALPIKSTGITDAMESFKEQKPTPPIINKVVKPEDPAFKELGLTKKTHVKTYDFTDATYLDEVEDYNAKLGLKIILLGLDIKIMNKDKVEITDSEEKIKVLKGMGLSQDHFSQIVEDITNLTKWDEERQQDFLE